MFVVSQVKCTVCGESGEVHCLWWVRWSALFVVSQVKCTVCSESGEVQCLWWVRWSALFVVSQVKCTVGSESGEVQCLWWVRWSALFVVSQVKCTVCSESGEVQCLWWVRWSALFVVSQVKCNVCGESGEVHCLWWVRWSALFVVSQVKCTVCGESGEVHCLWWVRWSAMFMVSQVKCTVCGVSGKVHSLWWVRWSAEKDSRFVEGEASWNNCGIHKGRYMEYKQNWAAVFWRALPNRGLGRRERNAREGESEHRITVAFVSAAGVKQKQIVTQKSKIPEVWRSLIRVRYLFLISVKDKKAWMAGETMESIFMKLQNQLSSSNCKILLMVDNAVSCR